MNYEDRKEIIENISYLIKERDIPKLKNIIVDTHPADIADIMRDLDEDDANVLFGLLDSDTASDVIVELDEVSREQIIEDLEEGRLTELVDEMDSDDATDVVSELSDDLKEKVLSHIEPEDRHEVERLIVHDEETAGGIMALEFISVYNDQTVDDAIQEIRTKAQEVEQVYNVYASDRGGRLVGIVPVKRLLLSNPKRLIGDIMNHEVISVTVEKDQEKVANLFRKYDLISIPVVDEYNRLVGRITVDDIVDVLQEEANEDLQRMAGIADEEILQEMSTFRISRVRLPWLIVGFIGQIISALVMSKFKATLEQILVVAFFIPLIMAMGGNAGIQSSTIVVRSIALAEGGTSDRLSRILRELRVATLNGLVISLLMFVVIALWQKEINFAVFAGLAMLFVIINAGVVGAVIPFILNRLKIDPAIATGPFITTANDVFGLLIYLGLATVYLNHYQ
jgi:magnesium transporter